MRRVPKGRENIKKGQKSFISLIMASIPAKKDIITILIENKNIIISELEKRKKKKYNKYQPKIK